MRKPFLLFTILLLIVSVSNDLYGQGCSDAGFCTINSFKPSNAFHKKVLNNQFKVGGFVGSADNSVSVYGAYFEYAHQLNTRGRI